MSDEARETQRRAVNVNTATVEQLSREVTGIGPVLAERIVAWREAHGPFARRDDLRNVPGIGPALLARLGEQLTVEEEPTTSVWGEESLDRLAPEEAPDDLALQETPADEASPDLGEGEAPGEAAPPEMEVPSWDTLDLEPPLDETGPAMPFTQAAEQTAVAEDADTAEQEVVAEQAPGAPSGPAKPAPEEAPSTAPAQAPRQRRSFWSGLWLVLLGGLAGVALTLLAAVIWSGTVDFAPRRQFEALSRNVNTMYANQDLAWQRLDELTARADELERKVKHLESMEERLGTVESGLRTAETRLASVHDGMTSLSARVASLQEEMKEQWGQLDGRLTSVESEVEAMAATVTQLQEELSLAQARIKAYDGFLQGLRALLQDLEATPAAIETPQPTMPALSAPEVTPTPTPAISGG